MGVGGAGNTLLLVCVVGEVTLVHGTGIAGHTRSDHSTESLFG